MKRFLIFIVGGPSLAAATLYAIFLPLASLVEQTKVTITIDREYVWQIMWLLAFLGFVLWLLDWVTGIMEIPHRPLIAATLGFTFAWLGLRGFLTLPDIPGWWISVGLIGAIPAYICSWLGTKVEKPKAA